jgi:hypothetical protein
MAYVEKLQFDPQKVAPLQKVFIRCTKSEFAPFGEGLLRKFAGVTDGSTVLELPTGHISQATMPDELAQLLLRITNQ